MIYVVTEGEDSEKLGYDDHMSAIEPNGCRSHHQHVLHLHQRSVYLLLISTVSLKRSEIHTTHLRQ